MTPARAMTTIATTSGALRLRFVEAARRLGDVTSSASAIMGDEACAGATSWPRTVRAAGVTEVTVAASGWAVIAGTSARTRGGGGPSTATRLLFQELSNRSVITR